MTTLPPQRPKRPERRQHDREPVEASAQLRDGASSLSGTVENIGLHSAAFATREMEPALRIGATITLVAPGAGEAGADLEFHGRVVRTDEFRDGLGDTRTYALEFDPPADP